MARHEEGSPEVWPSTIFSAKRSIRPSISRLVIPPMRDGIDQHQRARSAAQE